jgi:MFS family permease
VPQPEAETTIPTPPHTQALRATLGLFVVCLGAFAAPLDSAVNVAFPSITQSFARDVQDIRWVVISYVLTYSSLLLIFGKLGDLVGYRLVFQAGLAASAVGFAACSLAGSFEALLAGRVLQGIGIALVLSCAPALATSLYLETERTRILGIYAAVTALGTALGPIAGGILVAQFGWGGVFWFRMPLVVVALAMSWLIPAGLSRGSTRGLDPIGSVQLVIALVAILMSLSIGIAPDGLTMQLALAAIGVATLAAFLRRQSRHAAPIIRPALFRDPRFSLMNLASIVANFAAFSVMLIGPFYLIRVSRLDSVTTGLVLALAAVGAILGATMAARVIRSVGGARTAVLGMLLSAAGLAAIASWSAETRFAAMALPLLAQGLGLGLFQVAYTDLVTATLPVEDRGVAGSLTMLTRTIGLVGGAAGHAALFRHFERAALASGASATEAFMSGFQAVFVGAAAAQVLAIALGILIASRCRPSGSAGG